ncbi:putative Glycoprotein endo-alpha-1; 2-mannosidase [Paratrimastix pyriformis]|uniref:Glycoprotein endo-alpha-1 n=1 Tax=Paratrimastix pyriformis TaxID=342808 RepID=A0ABQ8UL31_9EUKA|nr:putative Glycoprotein endo-alpha-1; 2-mannosidase [Paratrimastix pyriformis]
MTTRPTIVNPMAILEKAHPHHGPQSEVQHIQPSIPVAQESRGVPQPTSDPPAVQQPDPAVLPPPPPPPIPTTLPVPDDRVQAFYYPWYGNPTVDKKYFHWNHEIFDDSHQFHKPPASIGSAYWPELGLYSSADPEIVDKHMEMMKEGGIGVVVVSWLPPRITETQKYPLNDRMQMILDRAAAHGLKVAVHHEPYEGRSGPSIATDLIYLQATYGAHPALYRREGRIVLYVYDSYAAPNLGALTKGTSSIRGKPHDAFLIGLLVESLHLDELHNAGFDAAYTYFATDGFTYGSSTRVWATVASKCKQFGMLFVPCVGPGYDDRSIRPWNARNYRGREAGTYYDRMWNAALVVTPSIVGVTSFNEWHEGTQIEPVVAHNQYPSYEQGPRQYLQATARHAARLREQTAPQR